MTSAAASLYLGSVRHVRLGPQRHALRYRALWLLLDLDMLPALGSGLRLLSRDRFNLFGFHERDHGDGRPTGLRGWIDAQLAAAARPPAARVRLLTMPRVLGYVFNPLSLFLCHGADGGIETIIYEVRNTFGGRHCYLIPADPSQHPIRQSCRKAIYVSPFLPMDLRYRFTVTPPEERVAVAIDTTSPDGSTVLAASLSGRRRPLTDGALLGAFLTRPALTLKVIAAIHWEALLLWRKGARFHRRPAPPSYAVTAVTPGSV